jgi:hypothetical protein
MVFMKLLVARLISSVFFKTLIYAEPIIAPFVNLQAASKVFLSFIPNPARMGFARFISFSFLKYHSWSSMAFVLPVVDEEETA